VTFPAGLHTITVTGENVLGIGGEPLSGVVIFSASGPVDDPADDAVLSGSAVGEISNGVMTPVVIPTTDAVSPGFTYTVTVRLQDADGNAGGPPPVTGVHIPATLGPTVDLSALL